MYINKTQKCTTVLQVVVLKSIDVVRRGKYDALCVQKENNHGVVHEHDSNTVLMVCVL